LSLDLPSSLSCRTGKLETGGESNDGERFTAKYRWCHGHKSDPAERRSFLRWHVLREDLFCRAARWLIGHNSVRCAPCCGESICKLSSRDRRNRTGVSLVAVKQTRVAARCVSSSFIPPRYGTGSYALSRYSVQYREWHIRLLDLSDFIWHPQKWSRIPTRIKKRRFVE
jgi:hypothetical protein